MVFFVALYLCATVAGPCQLEDCQPIRHFPHGLNHRVCREGDFVYHEWAMLPHGSWSRAHPPGHDQYCPRSFWTDLWTEEVNPHWQAEEDSGMYATTRHPFWQLPPCEEDPNV